METTTLGPNRLHSTSWSLGSTDMLAPVTQSDLGIFHGEDFLTSTIKLDIRSTTDLLNSSDLLNYGNDTGMYDLNTTGGGLQSMDPALQCESIKKVFFFDHLQLVRVLVTWILFFISSVGNVFVLSCVYRKARTSHVHLIMLHFTLADLAYTFMVMPMDAIWNTTMEWRAGDFLCRMCQMFKQMGMYISSFMVVVLALDRCWSILQPMSTPPRQRRRTKRLVGSAWLLSIISAIPPAILFTVVALPFCPDREPFTQCVDFIVVPNEADRRPYLLFTMFMSFVLPMVLTAVSYSLVVCEISNMMRRDRVMMGRRDSSHNITRARRKTLFITSVVTLSFLVFWGPYYGFAIYDWFQEGHTTQTPREVTTGLFLLMYVHPAIHPILYGVLMKDVRVKFGLAMSSLERIVTCNSTETRYGRKTLNCLSSSNKRGYRGGALSNGSLRTDNRSEALPGPTGDAPGNRIGQDVVGDAEADEIERWRLISAENDPPRDGSPERKVRTGKTKRCSTVTFNLSDSAVDNGVVWNNNNEKILESDSCDSVFKSTIL